MITQQKRRFRFGNGAFAVLSFPAVVSLGESATQLVSIRITAMHNNTRETILFSFYNLLLTL